MRVSDLARILAEARDMNTRTGLSGSGVVVLAVLAGGGVGATAQAPAAVARVLTVANNGKTVTIAAADLKTLPRARAEIKDEGLYGRLRGCAGGRGAQAC